jgi:hypothetical protein
MARTATAIGCRVKSGWAMTVLLAGSATAPRVLDRRRILLSDPAVPASTQPFHAGFGTLQTDARVLRRLTSVVTRAARRSMAGLLRACHALPDGPRPRGVGIVVGSTIDPATIGNEHIRAHASEGRLFRTVLEDAARRHRLKSTVVRERDLAALAAKVLRRPPDRLRRDVAALGKAFGGPWRAEEKTAALAAWIVLARRR